VPLYKVYEVSQGYQIFWCPSAPMHYHDRIPYNDHIYPHRQAAYRKCKQLNEGTTREQRKGEGKAA
jgi:hypothetical protein